MCPEPTQEPSSLSMSLISVDTVVLRLYKGRLQVLTGPALHPNAGHNHALPAGRIAPDSDHTLEQTARRHIGRLTKAPVSWLEQVETIGNDQRDSRGWSLTVVYFALVRSPEDGNNCREEIDEARWFDIPADCNAKLPVLAYDHQKLLQAAISRLRNKCQYTTIPLYLLPVTFTLADIREVFESLLGKAPPTRSLRNRFLSGTILKETGEKRHGSNRPATLYRIGEDNGCRVFNRLYESTR